MSDNQTVVVRKSKSGTGRRDSQGGTPDLVKSSRITKQDSALNMMRRSIDKEATFLSSEATSPKWNS